MNNWNGLDFFIFLIFAVNTLLGMNRGAAKEIISMMCLCVGLIFAVKFTIPVAAFFNSSPLMNTVVDNKIMQNFMLAINAGPLTIGLLKELFFSISLLICFMGAFCVCEGVLNYTGFTEYYSFPYATLSRKIGAGLGCVRGYVFTLILLLMIAHIFSNTNVGQSNSFFARLFQGSVARMDNVIAGQRPESYRDILRDKNLYTPKDVFKNIKNDGVSDQNGNMVTPRNQPPARQLPPPANTNRGLNIQY